VTGQEATTQQSLEPTPTCGYTIDETMPLYQLFKRRMRKGRDLKIIITAKNSQTGTGKTTLGFWLAHQFNTLFSGEEFTAERNATLNVGDFFDKFKNLPEGSCLILDEAEQLDARRSMASDNVDFSHQWMVCRFRQVCSIIVLPTTSALDSRLEELADVWIEVTRRGAAQVHGIQVNSYSKNVQTPKGHRLTWPDVSHHSEMQALDAMKDERMDEMMNESESPDIDEIQREDSIEKAIRSVRPWSEESGQSARDVGKRNADDEDYIVDYSYRWVSERVREWREGQHRELVPKPEVVTT